MPVMCSKFLMLAEFHANIEGRPMKQVGSDYDFFAVAYRTEQHLHAA